MTRPRLIIKNTIAILVMAMLIATSIPGNISFAYNEEDTDNKETGVSILPGLSNTYWGSPETDGGLPEDEWKELYSALEYHMYQCPYCGPDCGIYAEHIFHSGIEQGGVARGEWNAWLDANYYTVVDEAQLYTLSKGVLYSNEHGEAVVNKIRRGDVILFYQSSFSGGEISVSALPEHIAIAGEYGYIDNPGPNASDGYGRKIYHAGLYDGRSKFVTNIGFYISGHLDSGGTKGSYIRIYRKNDNLKKLNTKGSIEVTKSNAVTLELKDNTFEGIKYALYSDYDTEKESFTAKHVKVADYCAVSETDGINSRVYCTYNKFDDLAWVSWYQYQNNEGVLPLTYAGNLPMYAEKDGEIQPVSYYLVEYCESGTMPAAHYDLSYEEYEEYLVKGNIPEDLRHKAEFDKDNGARVDCTYHAAIKGICQMPYEGEGGGYLIGIESFDNPNGEYSYEMLILDCTLYAKGEDAWIYSTGRCYSDGNCLWTIWQPEYGYFWTLFRIYDKNGECIDEMCFGFENI